MGRFTGTGPESGRVLDDPTLVLVPPGTGGPPDASVRGTAADLDLWLWHRADDRTLTFDDDERVPAALREGVATPVDRPGSPRRRQVRPGAVRCGQVRGVAPCSATTAATAASRAAAVSASVSVRSSARNRSAKASDLRPASTWSPR